MDRLLPEKSQAYRRLDVSVLHSLVLEKFLRIDRENMANQKNLTYTRDAAEAEDSVRRGESQCCFLLNPHPGGGDRPGGRRRGEDAPEVHLFLPQAHHGPGDEPPVDQVRVEERGV